MRATTSAEESDAELACRRCGGTEAVDVAPVRSDGPTVAVCSSCWPEEIVPVYRFAAPGGDPASSSSGPRVAPDLLSSRAR